MNVEQKNNLVQASKILVDNGALFIPLIPNDKRPRVAFKKRIDEGNPFTPQEMKSFRSQGCGTALLAQPNFLFIDVDTKEHWRHTNPNAPESEAVDGIQNFRNWLTEHELDPDKIYASTLHGKTASGGDTLVFLQRPNDHFTQDIDFLEGVDIKASPNNYVAIAPTKINGRSYEWLNAIEPAVIPDVLAEAMQSQAKTTKKKIVDSGGYDEAGVHYYSRNPDAKDPYYRIDTWDVVFKTGFGEEGSRNQHLFEFAGAMRNQTGFENAVMAAQVANQQTKKRNGAGLDEDEIVNTINSAYMFDGQFQADLDSGRLRREPYLGDQVHEPVLAFQGRYADTGLAVLQRDYDHLKSTDPADYRGRLLSTEIIPMVNSSVARAVPGIKNGELFNANKSSDVEQVRDLVIQHYAKEE